MSQITTESRTVSRFAKFAFKAQIFLLRRNWMGKMGKIVMIITTTGRKSGRSFSTPIGFQRDKDTIIAFNVGGISNWYKNIAQNPLVTLEIQQQVFKMRGEYVTNNAEIKQIIMLYQREQPAMMQRFFGIPADAQEADMMKAAEKVKFVRFFPV